LAQIPLLEDLDRIDDVVAADRTERLLADAVIAWPRVSRR
jgi:hypothetical protein